MFGKVDRTRLNFIPFIIHPHHYNLPRPHSLFRALTARLFIALTQTALNDATLLGALPGTDDHTHIIDYIRTRTLCNSLQFYGPNNCIPGFSCYPSLGYWFLYVILMIFYVCFIFKIRHLFFSSSINASPLRNSSDITDCLFSRRHEHPIGKCGFLPINQYHLLTTRLLLIIGCNFFLWTVPLQTCTSFPGPPAHPLLATHAPMAHDTTPRLSPTISIGSTDSLVTPNHSDTSTFIDVNEGTLDDLFLRNSSEVWEDFKDDPFRTNLGIRITDAGIPPSPSPSLLSGMDLLEDTTPPPHLPDTTGALMRTHWTAVPRHVVLASRI